MLRKERERSREKGMLGEKRRERVMEGGAEGRVYYHAIACINTLPADKAVEDLIPDKFI